MRCAVPSCKTRKYGRDSAISFHGFPKTKCRKDEWIAALKLNPAALSPRSMVCSLHFRKQDFQTNSTVYRSGLRTNAIPHLADELPDFVVIEIVNSDDENQAEAQMISCDEDAGVEDFFEDSSNLELPPCVDFNDSSEADQAACLELQRTKELAKINALRKVENILPLSNQSPTIELQQEKDHEPEDASLVTMELEDKVRYLQKALVEKDRAIKLLNTKLRFKSERILHLISKLKRIHKLINKRR